MDEHAPAAPSAGPGVVVAAAILDATGERVLAARRTRPPVAAGRWELPGGKVEPGESVADALTREIGEELGCVVEVEGWLPGESPVGDGLVLRAATVRLVAGEPRPREHDGHDAVRWLAADELGEVDWLEPDRPFLVHLRELLVSARSTGSTPSAQVRGIFFDEEDAAQVVARLRDGGWDATMLRERYHGEDDDEGHPWAVTTDAPELVLEVLVDEYDGWLDVPGDDASDVAGVAPEPIALPSEPRRIKRPDLGDPT